MKTLFCALLVTAFLGSLATGAAPHPASVPSPAPELFLSLRGVTNQTVEVGEPLFFAVRIEASDETSAPTELRPASGTWSDAIEVAIVSVSSAAAKVRAQPALSPEKTSVTLDAERHAGGVWFVASSATGQLAPGEYVARARFTIAGSNGWNGEAISEETSLRVVLPSNSPERVRQRAMSRAHEAVVTNAPAEAAHLLDAELARDPDDISLLTLRAALCLRGGDLSSALVCVNRAIDRFEKSGSSHPPSDLFALESQISLALLSPPTTAVPPPDWTRLPANVVAPGVEKQIPAPVQPAALTARTSVPANSPAPPIASPMRVAIPAVSRNSVPLKTPNAESPSNAAPIGSTSLGVLIPAADLTDAKLLAEAGGQWAATATASSVYGKTQYSAAQATGAPNIKVAGNSPDAWCPARKNEGTEWLEVSFAKPVHATEVRIRQNDAPGCIVKIEAIEPEGAAHVWWEGVDPYVAPPTREIAWFAVRVPKSTYLVAKVKITLNLAAVSGWKEIDAVQLVGQP